MSRRGPNPAADRAAQNQQTIKTLLKLEGNKTCADCKRNKHPRWASWNLGVFVCIRCSGIHRGMGTHISRVKSVDLDAWTDEQLQSVLNWGNSRANKYWEAKLATGHVPSEAKIENFIRTKYESKRWVMEGPMPDPATLDDEGDDDVPLNVVQEKAKLERSSSQQKSSSSTPPTTSVQRLAPNSDIFGDMSSPPARPSTTDASGIQPPPSKPSAPSRQPEPSNSLMGLDFFGGSPSAASGKPTSASSTPSNSIGPSRPDLKQSILSLYASAPRPQAQQRHERQSSFGGLQSSQQQTSFGGMDDAFSGLTFTPTTSASVSKQQEQSKPNPFAALDKPFSQRSTVASPQLTSSISGGGGGFFDTSSKPAVTPAAVSKPPIKSSQTPSSNYVSSGLRSADLSASSAKSPTVSKSSPSSNLNDLFDFSEAPTKESAPQNPAAPILNTNSAFNLSAPSPALHAPHKVAPSTFSNNTLSGFSTADPWASNDAWASPEPSNEATNKAKTVGKSPSITTTSDFSSWGGASSSASGLKSSGSGIQGPPKVAADEDFGGWNSAVPVAPVAAKPSVPSTTKPAGNFGSGSEDLFSNVWE